jgi:hypothetical protein
MRFSSRKRNKKPNRKKLFGSLKLTTLKTHKKSLSKSKILENSSIPNPSETLGVTLKLR